MKINIGPYVNWFGPFQIAEKLLFWKDRDSDEVFNLGQRLDNTWLRTFCEKLHERKDRKVKIHIDDYDVWNMDSTLALIIHPMLVKLKAQKHGSAHVDLEDVPERLRYTTTPDWSDQYTFDFYKGEDYDHDDPTLHDRWDWVLYEMIWAFEQLNTDWEDQYYDHSEVDHSKGISEQISSIKCDYEGLKKHSDRISNGLRLFGKYYRGLWD